MNIKAVAATFGAALLLTGAPAFAATGASASPIVISDVQVQPGDEDGGRGPGFVSLAFDNTSNQVATEVIFELDVDGNYADHFDDVGSFAPGTSVRHAFQTDSGSPDQQLKVAEVKFADGSVWVNDADDTQPDAR